MTSIKSGPISWPQQENLAGRSRTVAKPRADNLLFAVGGHGLPVKEVLEKVRLLILRHEALRTTFDYDERDGSGTQYVSAPPRTVADLDDLVTITPPASAQEVFRSVSGRPFDMTKIWQVALTLSVREDRVSEAGFAVGHSALDGWGAEVLRRDFTALLSSADVAPGNAVRQSLDVAAWERSPDGLAHRAAATRFWRTHLRTLRDSAHASTTPAGVRNVRKIIPKLAGAATVRSSWLSSRTLPHAAAKLSGKIGAPPSTVFLTAFGAALCAHYDVPLMGLMMLSANRWEEPLESSAIRMIMPAPVLVYRTTPGEFARTTHRVLSRQLTAYERGHMDGRLVAEAREEIFPESAHPAISGAIFNYINFVPDGGGSSDMLGAWEADEPVEWDRVVHEAEKPVGSDLMLVVHAGKSHVSLQLTYRTDLLTLEAAERILLETAESIHASGRPSAC